MRRLLALLVACAHAAPPLADHGRAAGVSGAGASTDVHVDYYFNSTAPICSWTANGAF